MRGDIFIKKVKKMTREGKTAKEIYLILCQEEQQELKLKEEI